MGSACHFLPKCRDPATAELLACKHAVQLAHEINANSLHIEMDCKEIVSKLQSKERDLSTLGPIIGEVKQMLDSRERWKITWVRRTANSAAHLLAKESVLRHSCKVWLNEPPDCILQKSEAKRS